MKTFLDCGASWIWITQDEQCVNQYVEFRREFYLESLPEPKVSLYLSSDSNYAVWMNGIFVNCGQFSNYPEDKTYDVLNVGKMLKAGKNVLCVLVYYQGRTSFSYLKGEPGLLFSLEGESFSIVSDERTYCRKSRAYQNGPIYNITPQLSFAFEYNAAKKDEWLVKDYDAGQDWEKAKVMTEPENIYRLDLKARPLKKLDIHSRSEIRMIAQGVFIRVQEEGKTPAQLVQSDFLSARRVNELVIGGDFEGDISRTCIEINPAIFDKNKGVYFVIDLGREEAGLFEMEVETTEGTVIDIAHGEHLDDLRVRASVGGRNFANRYICCEGRQVFTYPFKRFGCRFIEIHVLNAKEKFIFHYAGLRPTEYPVDERGTFTCSDNLANKIYQTSVRTLHLCMHEHYEDSPWREQALYGMDSRNQALCGYYCFGEYDFPEVSFSLLGRSLKEDGYLEIVAPSEFEITIPSFCMAWILEVWEHYLYSGRLESVKCLMPTVEKMIKTYMGNIQEGLLVTPQDKRYWNFYEWAEGLDGNEYKEVDISSIRYDAPLNLFFHIALQAAAKLAEAVGKFKEATEYHTCADVIQDHFHGMFWVESKRLYQTYVGGIAQKEHFAELTQALALYAGVCPEALMPGLRQKLADENNDMVKTTLSYSIYKFEALLRDPDQYAKIIFDSITKDWGHMLYHGATSFWETIKGADDFDKAGSLCHGWSAIPVYFYYAYILGIKPIEPGFRVFKAQPLCNILQNATGKVPTPYGDIQVIREKVGDEFKMNILAPEGTKMQ